MIEIPTDHIRGLVSDEIVEELAAVSAELVTQLKPEIILFTGSIAAGLTHRFSDLDLILVTKAGPTRALRNRAGSVSVDVEVLSWEDYCFAVDYLAAYRASTKNRDWLKISPASLKRYTRLVIGLPMYATTEGREAHARIDRDVLRRVVMSGNANSLASLSEDVAGALAGEQPLTSLEAASLAMRAAMECVLASLDDLYQGPKFLLERLQRSQLPQALIERLLHLLHPGLDAAEDSEVIEEMVRVATVANDIALVNGWDRPARGEDFTSLGSGWDVGGATREPWYSLIRFGDEFGLAGIDRGFAVSAVSARAWSLLGTVPLDRIAQVLAGETGVGENDAAQALSAFVAKMRQEGIVKIP